MNVRNLSITKKLSIGFGAVLAIVAGSSAFVAVKIDQFAEIRRMNSTSDAVIDLLDQARGDIDDVRAKVRRFVITGQAVDKAGFEPAVAELFKHISNVEKIVSKDGPEFLPALMAWRSRVDDFVEKVGKPEIELASDPATRQQAVLMVGGSSAYSSSMDEGFSALREKVSTWADSWTATGDKAMTQIRMITLLSGIVSVLIGIAMAWLIIRAIGRPLTAMTGVMRRLASGDTSILVPALAQTDEVGQMAAAVQSFKLAAIEKLRFEKDAADSRQVIDTERARNETIRAQETQQQDEVVQSLASALSRLSQGDLVFRLGDRFPPAYETLRADFNGAIEQLQNTIKEVSGNTSAIRSGASEISSASDDLSRRTEQQAASLEETAAALDEITATVKKTSDGSIHARTVVASAKSDAERSGTVVGQAIEAMSAIEQSAQKVTQIIGVIDEIAFQTNLLALNAGVEAARAGEAGRGFAVVASEVRALAQRSAEAAKEIKALISTSSQQVSTGVDLVNETGDALKRIVSQVAEINAVVSDIATSTQEQATALQEVNTAINQMDQVTQQNAAMVEQSTAASKNLAQEAESLARLVSRFQTGQEAVQKVSRGRPAQPDKTVPTLRPTGRGGAALKPTAAASEDWQEF